MFVTQRNLPQCVRIEVRDTGDGIEEDKIKLIFDKYYRSENHKREVVGTGLGLSIVKEILKMHNYNYGVNSKLGEGLDLLVRDPGHCAAGTAGRGRDPGCRGQTVIRITKELRDCFAALFV